VPKFKIFLKTKKKVAKVGNVRHRSFSWSSFLNFECFFRNVDSFALLPLLYTTKYGCSIGYRENVLVLYSIKKTSSMDGIFYVQVVNGF